MFEVTVEETFAAGHALRGYRGKCENVHGHNYRVQLTMEGAVADAMANPRIHALPAIKPLSISSC